MAEGKFFNGPASGQPARPYVAGSNPDAEIVPSPAVVQAQHHLTDVQIFRVAATPPSPFAEQLPPQEKP